MKVLKITALAAVCCLLLGIGFTHAQVITKNFINGVPAVLLPVQQTIEKKIELDPPADFRNAMNKTEADNNKPYASGSVLQTDIDVISNASKNSDGKFITYTLAITAREAHKIKLSFSSFFLSKNADLTLFTKNALSANITAA